MATSVILFLLTILATGRTVYLRNCSINVPELMIPTLNHVHHDESTGNYHRCELCDDEQVPDCGTSGGCVDGTSPLTCDMSLLPTITNGGYWECDCPDVNNVNRVLIYTKCRLICRDGSTFEALCHEVSNTTVQNEGVFIYEALACNGEGDNIDEEDNVDAKIVQPINCPPNTEIVTWENNTSTCETCPRGYVQPFWSTLDQSKSQRCFKKPNVRCPSRDTTFSNVTDSEPYCGKQCQCNIYKCFWGRNACECLFKQCPLGSMLDADTGNCVECPLGTKQFYPCGPCMRFSIEEELRRQLESKACRRNGDENSNRRMERKMQRKKEKKLWKLIRKIFSLVV